MPRRLPASRAEPLRSHRHRGSHRPPPPPPGSPQRNLPAASPLPATARPPPPRLPVTHALRGPRGGGGGSGQPRVPASRAASPSSGRPGGSRRRGTDWAQPRTRLRPRRRRRPRSRRAKENGARPPPEPRGWEVGRWGGEADRGREHVRPHRPRPGAPGPRLLSPPSAAPLLCRFRHRATAETAGFPPCRRDPPRPHPTVRPYQSSAARPARPPTAVSHPQPHAVPAVEARSHLCSVLVMSPARSHLCPARRAGFFPISALKTNTLQQCQAGRLFPQRGIAHLQGAVSTELSQGLYLCYRAFSSTSPARSDRTHFSPTPAEGALGSDLGMPTAVGCENLSSLPPTLHKQEHTSGSPSSAVCLPLGSPVHFDTTGFSKPQPAGGPTELPLLLWLSSGMHNLTAAQRPL